jgi:hypothetical protein
VHVVAAGLAEEDVVVGNAAALADRRERRGPSVRDPRRRALRARRHAREVEVLRVAQPLRQAPRVVP